MKILELFGGIGACTSALKRLNIDFEIADYVEIDKYAVASYNAINGTHFETQDIRNWNKDIQVDLIMHGSPCQDFSLAGYGKGGDEGSGTRSSLMYETIRIVNNLKPKYVIWENVKNLISKKHRHNFDNYLQALKEGGYTNHWQVLNSKDYGTPQSRERVFVISIRKDLNQDFNFPPRQELKLTLKDLLEENVDEKYILNDKQIERILTTNYISGGVQRIQEEICGTLCARDYKDPKCVRIKNNTRKGYLEAYDGDGINICGRMEYQRGNVQRQSIGTIDHQGGNNKGVLLHGKIRKLTPKECWRLMGFTDEEFEKASQVNSNTQLYKQARKFNSCKCANRNI